MAAANIESFRALARKAEVSLWAVNQLRRDRIDYMRVTTLQQLATALQLPLPALLNEFGVTASTFKNTKGGTASAQQITVLETEYERLQVQLAQQKQVLQLQLQREALATLESWLVQWPTIEHAVAKKPDLPASRLVPLVQPVQDLLEQWGVVAIAPVGAEVPFDPQQHELLDGTAEPGDLVRVRYAGFKHGETLLYRARVSRVD